jgi:hypothetical protein
LSRWRQNTPAFYSHPRAAVATSRNCTAHAVFDAVRRELVVAMNDLSHAAPSLARLRMLANALQM